MCWWMIRAKGYRKREGNEAEHDEETEPSQENRNDMSESESTSKKKHPRCDLNGEQRKQDFNAFVRGYEFSEEVEAKQAATSGNFVVSGEEDDEESGGTYFANTPQKKPKNKVAS